MPIFDFRSQSYRLRLYSPTGYSNWRTAHHRRERYRGCRPTRSVFSDDNELILMLGLNAEGIYRVSGRKTGVQQVYPLSGE
jgi:hypothetical protein